MSDVRARIEAGVCGFVTEVEAVSEDSQHVALKVTSPCQIITALGAALPELDAYAELGAGLDSSVYQTVRGLLRACCCGCVVPAGLLKAMQIAAGVALPGDVSVTFVKG